MAFERLRRWLAPHTRYAALTYLDTLNLGDEIQTIAATRFLPRVDAWVDRERLDEFQDTDEHKIILNGWFLHRPEHWPPSDKLKPLFVSFHLTREVVAGQNKLMLPPSATVLSPSGIAYLRRHEPIGARDLATLQQLESAGIKSWFSGCLTLTLKPENPSPRTETVYAVDVPDDVVSALERQYQGTIIRTSHVDGTLVGEARFQRARELLSYYASAKAVVTTRLHCALPCLALDTPVLFIERARDPYRFDGLRDVLNRTSEQELLSGHCDFDLNDPPQNKKTWHGLRDQLIRTCRKFVRS